MLFGKFGKKYGLLPYEREDIDSDSLESYESYGWQLRAFNIPEKWIQSQGEGVKVAVIDTGCDFNHKDLKDNMLPGKNFVNLKEDPMDKNGHGTHVAGTIAALKNGIGVTGVAPKSKIVPVKALGDNGSGDVNSIVRAIEWSADQGVDFITMSLGSPAISKPLENIIKYAHDKNCIIFCAAGNSGEEVDIMYPAKYDFTIAIGAVDRKLERTKFTCSGETLDFLAPGHEILSCVPGDQYAIMSGTSMSNPFAVGCACLALSWYKKHGRASELSTYFDYVNLFRSNAIHLKNPMYAYQKQYEGYGIINPV